MCRMYWGQKKLGGRKIIWEAAANSICILLSVEPSHQHCMYVWICTVKLIFFHRDYAQHIDTRIQVRSYHKKVVILYTKMLSDVFVYLNSKILTFTNYFIFIKHLNHYFKTSSWFPCGVKILLYSNKPNKLKWCTVLSYI